MDHCSGENALTSAMKILAYNLAALLNQCRNATVYNEGNT
jgi:hypothetical protein